MRAAIWRRTISSVVVIPIFLGLLYLGGWPLRLSLLALGVLGLREYFALLEKGGGLAPAAPAYILLPFLFWPGLFPGWIPLLVSVSLLLFFLWGLSGVSAAKLAGLAGGFFGLWYIGGGFSYLLALRDSADGMGHLILAVLATWAVDVTAFFTGVALGRHKLAPTLSPGKTVEGALGGLVGGVIIALLGGHFLGISTPVSLGAGLLVGLAAQAGDLAESALKRAVGVKDSGNFLPGHGGLLDRFDSLLFVLPVLYWYWSFIGTGG